MLSYVNKDMNVMVESKVYRTKAFMGMKSWVNFLVGGNAITTPSLLRRSILEVASAYVHSRRT